MSAWTATVLGLACAALSLGGCRSSSPPMDAGPRDTGPRDTGLRDTGSRDTGPRDTGPADSGAANASDSGVADPGWVPMPGLPEGCVIERAEHPERVFTPEWLTDPSCGPGCEFLAPPPPGMLRAYDTNDVWIDESGMGYFRALQGRQGDDTEVVFLGRTDAPVLAAWREPSPLYSGISGICSVWPLGYGAGDAAFVISAEMHSLPPRAFIYRAPLAEIGQATEPLHVLDERDLVGSNSAAELLLSPDWLVAEMAVGRYFLFLDADTRLKVAGPGAAVRAGPNAVLLGDDDLFWEDWSAGVRVARGNSAGNEHYFMSRLPEADIIGTSFLPSRLAWLQAYHPPDNPYVTDWVRFELWTSPWPAPGEPVTGHRVVADALTFGLGIGSDSKYAQINSDADGSNRRIDVWDLRDGRHRVFHPPGVMDRTGWGVIETPSCMTDSEMLVSVGTFYFDPSGIRTLARVQLDALPTVTP